MLTDRFVTFLILNSKCLCLRKIGVEIFERNINYLLAAQTAMYLLSPIILICKNEHTDQSNFFNLDLDRTSQLLGMSVSS